MCGCYFGTAAGGDHIKGCIVRVLVLVLAAWTECTKWTNSVWSRLASMCYYTTTWRGMPRILKVASPWSWTELMKLFICGEHCVWPSFEHYTAKTTPTFKYILSSYGLRCCQELRLHNNQYIFSLYVLKFITYVSNIFEQIYMNHHSLYMQSI